MPDILDLRREPVITDAQLLREASDRAAREDFDAGIGAALQHTPIADFVNGFYRTGFDEDPNFRWDRKLVDEFSQGIDTDLIPQFAGARSMEEAQMIRAQLLIKSDHRRALSNLGWRGQALTVAANLIDPVTLAVGVATGGVGELAALGAVTRAARMARMGVITGGGFAGLEAARSAVNPEIGGTDILAAGLSGLGFGVGSELTRGGGRLVRGLGIGAGGAAGPAGVDLIANQFRDEEEQRSVLWNGATNFMLGGILSVLTPGQRRAMRDANPALFRASEKISESGRRMQRDVEYATAKDSGATITPQGERYFRDQAGDQVARSEPLVAAVDDELAEALAQVDRIVTRQETLTEAAKKLEEARVAAIAAAEALERGVVTGVAETEVPAEVAAAVAKIADLPAAPDSVVVKPIEPAQEFRGQAMGAASPESIGIEGPEGPAMKVGDMDFSTVTDAAPMRPKLLGLRLPRIDPAGIVGKSGLPRLVKAINIFAKDPLPKADGSPSPFSAPEQVHSLSVSLRGRLLARLDAAYAKHRESAGELALDREAFNEQATRAWRRANSPELEMDPAARQAAESAAKLVGEVHGFAQRHKVPGFANFTHDKGYVPALWRQDLIDPMVTRFGQEQVAEKLLGAAILRGQWDLTPAQAASMGKAIIKNGGRRLSASEMERGRAFADSPERLAEALRDADFNLGDDDIARIVSKVMPRKDAPGTPTRARQRISMDHTFEADLIDPKTGQTVRVGVEDLLENNIESLVSRYAHQLYGASALTKGMAAIYPENPPAGIPGLIDRLRKDADQIGIKNVEPDLRRLEVVMKLTAGLPLYEDNATRQILRTITNMNYLRTMSNAGTGIQNFAEINQAMNELGWVNVAKHLGPAVDIFRRAADGTMTTPMLREIEAMGIGLDRLVSRVTPRLLGDEGTLAATGKAEFMSAKAARFASDVSLQSFGQVTMEAAIAPAVIQKFADMARGGRPLGDFRMRAAGLDVPMTERIYAAMKDPETGAVFKQDGTSVIDPRTENWTDVEAASAFRGAVVKITRRLALRVNPTELAPWMHTDTGRLAIFLRKFLIGSYTNKTLFEYAARDGIAAKNVVVGLVATGLTYVARTYLNSIGRPDAEEYRRKMLSMERISTAAIGRMPTSSFIPAVVDTAMNVAGRPEVFSHARTSGMSASLLAGNPIADWGLSVYNGYPPRALIGPLWSDYDFSRQDLNNLAKGFWIPNVVGARAVLEQLGVDLPARPETDR